MQAAVAVVAILVIASSVAGIVRTLSFRHGLIRDARRFEGRR